MLEKIMIFCEENPVMVIALLIVLALILTAFRIEGMVGLLGKAAGLILQQICSFFLETLFLAFKIINSLELYIVLLLDALTGKIGSSGKITSLAIGVLSIASFYTTFKGMAMFMEQPLVALLLTVGIQSILLSTSLRIGSNLEFSTEMKRAAISTGRFIPLTSGIFIVGMITAYVITLLPLDYGTKDFVLNMIYMLEIIMGLLIAFRMISLLLHSEGLNRIVGKFLFIIYFSVLAVSSFFSYNAFVNTMYPENIRTIDVFRSYKTQVAEVLDRRCRQVNTGYYSLVSDLMIEMLKDTANQMKNTSLGTFLTQDEINILGKGAEYQEYETADREKKRLKQRQSTLTANYNREVADLFKNSGGVGRYTNATHQGITDQYNKDVLKTEADIAFQDQTITSNYFQDPQHITQYNDALAKKKKFENLKDIQPVIANILSLLGKNQWTEEDEARAETLINTVEESRIQMNLTYGNNSLYDMLAVIKSFKRFNRFSHDLMNQILQCSMETSEEGFEVLRKNILDWSYQLLDKFPETLYVFSTPEGERIQTKTLSQKDIYNQIEHAYRNSNLNISVTEKNIRTFMGNKLIGMTCALFAVIIDMMILFVGVINPKGIDFFRDQDSKYSKSEKERILSNLFNKPIKR